jgi:hypothetical protein
MSNADLILRVGTAVAAVAFLAGPYLVAKVRLTAARWNQRREDKPEVSIGDAHTILEIASRLHAVSNDEGVVLCQKLIEVILRKPTV